MDEASRPLRVVAVVDDDARVLESMANLLASAGYEVRAFLSAAAFLQDQPLAGLHCLLCDIGMPDMDGWELRSRVREQCPGLPVILMTARSDQPPPGHATTGACAETILRKPFDASLLLTALAMLPGRQ
jgi:FixJ family two-component response regulator